MCVCVCVCVCVYTFCDLLVSYESWVHHFHLEMKEHWKQQRHPQSQASRKAKSVTPTGKLIAYFLVELPGKIQKIWCVDLVPTGGMLFKSAMSLPSRRV